MKMLQFVMWLLANTLSAQTRHTDSRAQNPRIDVTLSARLPDSMGTDFANMFSDSHGRFYEPRGHEGRIFVFDSLGRYLTAFGRVGSGPGEYDPGLLQGAAGPGDTIHIFTFGQPAQHTVLTPGTYRFVRRTLMPPPLRRPVILGGGRYAMPLAADYSSGATTTIGVVADRFPSPVERAFGGLSSSVPAKDIPQHYRFVLCTNSQGTLWSPHGFVLEEWNTSGRLLRVIHRNPEWREAGAAGSDRFGPYYQDCQVDSSGRLWLLIATSRSGPKDTVIPASRIEVIDPLRPSAIVSRDFPVSFARFLFSQRVLKVSVNADGETNLEVMRLRLQGPSDGKLKPKP